VNSIFVSYRRADSGPEAGRISDTLERSFGEDAVFRDVKSGSIPVGVDFRALIDAVLSECFALVAVIGPEWRQRLDEPGDLVRIEVATALHRGMYVAPLLVRGAVLAPESLPAELARLSPRNALSLTEANWRAEIGQLVEQLRRVLEAAGVSGPKAVQDAIARARAVARRDLGLAGSRMWRWRVDAVGRLLEPGEAVRSVALSSKANGSGLVVLTNRRLIYAPVVGKTGAVSLAEIRDVLYEQPTMLRSRGRVRVCARHEEATYMFDERTGDMLKQLREAVAEARGLGR